MEDMLPHCCVLIGVAGILYTFKLKVVLTGNHRGLAAKESMDFEEWVIAQGE